MSSPNDIQKLKVELEALRLENKRLRKKLEFDQVTKTVTVPEPFKEIFRTAEANVRRYFSDGEKSAENGEILISGERYLLVTARHFVIYS